jgi:hypothetical protein
MDRVCAAYEGLMSAATLSTIKIQSNRTAEASLNNVNHIICLAVMAVERQPTAL